MTSQSFGGPWTLEKLDILERYLDAYTTALKDQPFRLIYVDAFAGSGSYEPGSGYIEGGYEDFRELHQGSPRIALNIADKPFDRLVFTEQDPVSSKSLQELSKEFPGRNIEVKTFDTNYVLPRVCDALRTDERAVVFLDPFATQVSWITVKKLAQTEKIDCWILFPRMAIARMMPTSNEPTEALAIQLDRIFGGREHWRDFYSASLQQPFPMFNDRPAEERSSGGSQIADRYRERLESVFKKVAPTRRERANSKNSTMFDLFFAASNPGGADIAVRIADHILSHW